MKKCFERVLIDLRPWRIIKFSRQESTSGKIKLLNYLAIIEIKSLKLWSVRRIKWEFEFDIIRLWRRPSKRLFSWPNFGFNFSFISTNEWYRWNFIFSWFTGWWLGWCRRCFDKTNIRVKYCSFIDLIEDWLHVCIDHTVWS